MDRSLGVPIVRINIEYIFSLRIIFMIFFCQNFGKILHYLSIRFFELMLFFSFLNNILQHRVITCFSHSYFSHKSLHIFLGSVLI